MKTVCGVFMVLLALTVLLAYLPGNTVEAGSCSNKNCVSSCQGSGNSSGKCINSKCKCYPRG
uniref:Putative neurotoxin-A n=1 Tax=Lychas mucronatus TaxID=172552 RepID=KTXA_LYCMC|nr:RecName: Full=Putative neurotoxin-A; AltName: Full=KTx11; Flags: Precursor [Lychas mucronatus]ABY26666.1 neurotoxin KTx11 [Lychas mucronatus]